MSYCMSRNQTIRCQPIRFGPHARGRRERRGTGGGSAKRHLGIDLCGAACSAGMGAPVCTRKVRASVPKCCHAHSVAHNHSLQVCEPRLLSSESSLPAAKWYPLAASLAALRQLARSSLVRGRAAVPVHRRTVHPRRSAPARRPLRAVQRRRAQRPRRRDLRC